MAIMVMPLCLTISLCSALYPKAIIAMKMMSCTPPDRRIYTAEPKSSKTSSAAADGVIIATRHTQVVLFFKGAKSFDEVFLWASPGGV